MKAPPRSAVAPAFLTARAIFRIILEFSTEHGPAISAIRRPPTVRPPARTTVFPSLDSRLTSL